MTRVPVGVIGIGFIGPAHIEALRRLPDIEVVAIAAGNDAAAASKAKALGVSRGYGDWRRLVSDHEVQVVHVCTPNNLHFEMSKQALLAGKHVVCEKPLATEAREAAELVELAARKGLVNAVHFNVRYYPLMRQARLMVQKGDVGEIFSVHGSYLQDWLFYPTDYNWRLEPKLSGKSRAVADIGSHWMDLVEHITGLRITEVLADFATFHGERQKPRKPLETYAGKVLTPEDYTEIQIDTEDYASVLLHFSNGAHGVFTVSQVSAGRKNRITFEIDGSRRAVAWESETPNALWVGRRDAANEVMMKDPSLVYPEVRPLIGFPGGHNEGFPDTSKQMFREIYGYIASGAKGNPTFPTFEDGLRELVLCERILESKDKGAWVKV
ncbi:MAG TPA: Gfo/Idh/MocA family oxidoreductase [Spirochaetia bacterium]|nr:Gfo/Idh/MocA family oxidoreductase [Spirochaetia bacterium]